MTGKIKFLTVAVILIFGTWVLVQLRKQPQAQTPTPVAKPAPERFVPGVHY